MVSNNNFVSSSFKNGVKSSYYEPMQNKQTAKTDGTCLSVIPSIAQIREQFNKFTQVQKTGLVLDALNDVSNKLTDSINTSSGTTNANSNQNGLNYVASVVKYLILGITISNESTASMAKNLEDQSNLLPIFGFFRICGVNRQ